MVNQEDEASERRAREKLLARRTARAAAPKQTSANGKVPEHQGNLNSQGLTNGGATKKKQQQQQQQQQSMVQSKKPQQDRARNHKRDDKKMRSHPPEAPRDRGPTRGRHHYRDEFGRQPPPPSQWDYHRGGPPIRHRGPPPGRWERDRALPPHPRSRGRPRSPPRDYRRRDHHRSRRGRSHDSHSYSSRSRSRSLSSRSESSFSSSDSGSYRSDDSRSHSRSRSYSRSRSPSPQSPVEKKEEKDAKIEEPKKDNEVKDTVEKSQETKKDYNGSPSSKGSKDKKRSPSRSRSRSVSEDSRERSLRRGRDRKRKTSRKCSSPSRSPASSVARSHSPASYSDASSHYSSRRRKERKRRRRKRKEDGFSKDQRTIFVSQLVMRTTERDLKKYFKRKVGCKVNDVILLRDRRNSRNHKGCAYVEVGRIEDVATAVAVSGQPPDFQRFPILIKASEAEKNYANPLVATASPPSAIAVSPSTTSGFVQEKPTAPFLPPLRDEIGRLIESQKVYVGGLDPSIREDHLYALFSQFGNLQKVQLQYHPNTQICRGYAFLTFHDPKVSHLAIRTMAGKIVTGRPLKTGWANQNQQSAASIASGCIVVTSDQFPHNASELTQKALVVLAQMTGMAAAPMQQLPTPSVLPGVSSPNPNPTSLATMAEQELDKAMGLVGTTTTTTTVAPAIPTVADARATMSGGAMGATVAEARASLAADVAARQLKAATSAAAVANMQKLALIGNAESPTRHLLVHNMYDKDEETEQGWQVEIKEEFLDECSKFGTIEHAKVMHLEPGGKIFATFSDIQGAKNCAENLAGRWFDKRQLRVDYMPEANPP